MGPVSILLAWLWGIGVLALDASAEHVRLWPDVSRAGWVALPWVVLAGLSWRRSPSSPLSFVGPIAVAVPAVVVAARLDLIAGASAGPLGRALAGAALLALLGLAGAARDARTQHRLHGVLWSLWAIGAPLVHAGLVWTTGDPLAAPLGRGLAAIARASPLGWCHAWSRSGGLASAEFPFITVAIAAGLLACSGWRRPGSAGGAK